jgi:hypothetical protein
MKMRVVYDASGKSSNGLALNDILKVGPAIQQDLYSIILCFRTHWGIAKMYCQIMMNSEYCDL